jgi:AcrR family transcriptional regulator
MHDVDHKANIINAAQSVFAGYGYKKVTMDDIARKLNMTRSSLYYYYKNKEEIFIEVVNHELRLYAAEMAGTIESADTPEQKLAALAHNSINIRKKFINIYKLTFDDMMQQYEIFRTIKSQVLALHSAAITEILRGDRDLAGASDIDSDARLLSLSFRGVVFGSQDINDEQVQRDLVRISSIFYNGLRAMARENIRG